jgi:hypothetical protein
MRSSRRYERHLPGYPSGVSKPSKPLERCAEVRTPPNRGPSGGTARLGGGRTGRALRARTPVTRHAGHRGKFLCVSAWRGKTRPTGFASRRKRTNMRVGFIGLGMIGRCMAANLQKAGHQLIVHDLSGTAAESHFWQSGRCGPIRREKSARRLRSFSPHCRCRPMSSRWRSGQTG